MEREGNEKHASREIESLRKKLKWMQQIKNNVTKVKNAFDRFVRPNMVEEALFEPEAISVKTSKAEKQKNWKKSERMPKSSGTTTKGVTYAEWEFQNKKKHLQQ